MRSETGRGPAAAIGLALAAVLVVACESGGPTGQDGLPQVCPGCDPSAGGETTDFGATPTPCGWLAAPLEVSEEEAVALGFDVAALRARMERPIDAELSWKPYLQRRPQTGKPASGYEDLTRVEAQVQVTGLAYYRPDPARCDDGLCAVEAGLGTLLVEEASCATFLLLHYDLELSTLDDAIEASGEGEAAQWSEGFEAMIGDSAAELHGNAFPDLSEVRGTLELDPDTDAPYTGTLDVQFDFGDEVTHGYVTPTIVYTAINEYDDEQVFRYVPVQGTW